jgi:hypothetical protein
MEEQYLDIKEETLAYYSNDYLGVYRNELPPTRNPYPIQGKHIDYSKELNSHHFRSPEFHKLDSDKKNILIVGCSQTFGWEIDKQYTWPHIINDKLNKDFNVDIFNIAYPGASIHANIRNTYAFIRKYGRPDYIFMYLADSFRDVFCYHGNLFNVHYEYYKAKESKEFTRIFSHENQMLKYTTMLHGLEEYCDASGTKLIWSAWDRKDFDFFNKIGFKHLKDISLNFDAIEHFKNDQVEHIWERAYDQVHFGYKDHLALAQVFYEEFITNEK